MKLISMTDFVLEQTELLYELNQSKLIHRIVNYAQFLKQPLTLDMFIGDKALFEDCADLPRDFYIDLNVYIIQDIVKYDLTLTQHAIKQLGL